MSKSLILATAAVAGLAAGCSSSSRETSMGMGSSGSLSAAPAQPAAMSVPGVQRTATAADALHAMADELSRTRQTIGDTLTALDELTRAQGDLLAPYDRFIALNEQVDQADAQVARRAEDMRTRARDYITNWEVEVYGVEDADLRKQAESRRGRVRADYERISDAMRALRDTMQPFQRQLDDIERVLGNDLTTAGVRAVAPAAGRARQSGDQVQKRIDALIAEVTRVADAMTPAVPEAAAPQPSTSLP